MQIGAENAELVEYGRTLFVIEPALIEECQHVDN